MGPWSYAGGGDGLGLERRRFEGNFGNFEKVRGRRARLEGADFDHRALHQVFVDSRRFQDLLAIGKESRSNRLFRLAAMSRFLEEVFQASADIGQAGQITIAIERRILDLFFRLDERENLICERFVEDANRKPNQELPLRVIPGARKGFADKCRRLFLHGLSPSVSKVRPAGNVGL